MPDHGIDYRKTFLSGLAVIALGLLAGCADVTATANVPDQVTYSTAAPGEVTVSAKAVLATLPSDIGNTQYGVVISETGSSTWYARVLVRGGVVVLYQGGRCFDDGHTWEDDGWWRQQLSPGDAVAFPRREDVCNGDVRVVDAGAALGGGK